jgi:glutathione S-transferase
MDNCSHETRTHEDKVKGIESATIKQNEDAAHALMSTLEAMLKPGQQWLYGAQPTVLDTTLVPFLARMRDVKRDELVLGRLGDYLDRAEADIGWQKVMDGRKTMPGI